MDASPVAQDRAIELAELRRRAYGPDADIHDDPAAVARLRELESRGPAPALPERDAASAANEWERAALTGAAPVRQDASPVATLLGPLAPEAEDPEREISGSAPVAPSVPAAERRPKRRWLIAAGLGIFVGGFALGALALDSLQPKPSFVLEPQSDAVGLEDAVVSQFSGGADADSAVSFGELGGFKVWSVVQIDGMTCLFLTRNAEIGAGGCAIDGLDPIADLQMYGLVLEDDPRMEAGAPGRLVLHNGRVEAFVLDVPEPSVEVDQPAN
jgi:hypothetical protein